MTADHIRIRDLELILALHETGNVTRAAERIGVSEPAFSKQIRKIERRLQVRLFERVNSGMATTACGRSFIPHAYGSVHAFRRALHDAHESRFGERHKLMIGVCSLLSKRWVDLLQAVDLRSFHNVDIEVISAYTFDVLARLHRGELDLAVVTSPPPNSGITSVRVAAQPFMIVMREQHPLATKGSLRLRDLADCTWVFFERNVHPSLHDRILRRMQEENLQAHIRHRISQADHVLSLLREDSIVAWLTSDSAERAVGSGLVEIPLLDSEIQREIHLATLADNNSPLVSEYVRSFVRRLEDDRGPLQLRLPIDKNRAA